MAEQNSSTPAVIGKARPEPDSGGSDESAQSTGVPGGAATKVAAVGAAGVAGAQTAGSMIMMMQLLSMMQAAAATAASWVSGAVAALQGLSAAALSAVTTVGAGVVAVAVLATGAIFNQPVDDPGYVCATDIDVKAALGLVDEAGTDATMLENARTVWAVMSGWGMSNENIAGILGNWEAESGIKPDVVQGYKPLSAATVSNNGIGLGQWTFSRNTALRKFADDRGAEWYSMETQLAFLITGDEQMYIDVIKQMTSKSQGTPAKAAAYYRAEWERNRAGAASDPDRAAKAEKWFALMGGWGSWTGYIDGTLAQLAAQGSGLMNLAAEATASVVNTVLGWLGMICPQLLDDTASDEVPLWNGETPPAFAGEPGGATKPISIRGARVAHLYFAAYIASYGGQSDRGAECSYSDHCSGHAIDFMIKGWSTDEGKAHGWEVARFFQQNADALGVTYIIWNKQKWTKGVDSPDLEPANWRTYETPRGVHTPTNDHYDHVHVSFKHSDG